MKHLFIVCLLLLTFNLTNAQIPKSFPEDPSEFIAALTEYMSTSSKTSVQANAKLLEQTFAALNSEQQQIVIRTGNEMIKKKSRIHPHLDDFARGIIASEKAASETNQTEELKVYEALVAAAKPGSFQKIGDMADYMTNFYENGSLYQTTAKTWLHNDASYTIGMQGEKPFIQIDDLTLTGLTKKDTLNVYNTGGRYYPLDGRWLGLKGKIDWSRAGYDGNNVYAEFGKYSISMKIGSIKVDSAMLTFQPYLDRQIKGKLYDELLSAKPKGAFRFPKFSSTERNLSLKELSDDVVYKGGVSLEGQIMLGVGDDRDPASISIQNGGKTAAIVKSRRFEIDNIKKEISAESAAVRLNISVADSITHPAARFSYNMLTRVLRAGRGEGSVSLVAFQSPYHQMALGVNQLEWQLDSTVIHMNTVTNYKQLSVFFESYNYYELGAEEKFASFANENPLKVIARFVDSYMSRRLSAEDIAMTLGSDVNSASRIFNRFMEEGFIYYDKETKDIIVYDKALNYVQAGEGYIDYDDIRLISAKQGSNGYIDLETMEMTVKGIDAMQLSKKYGVNVFPNGKEIRIGKNRNISFDGLVQAGGLDFKGRDMTFNYEEFKLELNEVDSLNMFVEIEKPEEQKIVIKPIKTVLTNVSGSVFIDDPSDKSGRMKTEGFPYFDCNKHAVVHFTDPLDSTILDEDRISCEIDPFKLDKIDHININDLKFQATANIGRIFKPFKTELIVQNDRTLGFNHETGDQGIPLYEDKGMFYNTLTLNKEGLSGDGRLQYGNVVAHEGQYSFSNDSIFGAVTRMNILRNKGANSPAAKLDSCTLVWYPSKDTMIVEPIKSNASFFDGRMDYNGVITVANNSFSGVTSVNWKEAEISSSKIYFTYDGLTTENAKVRVNDENNDSLFVGYNFKLSGFHDADELRAESIKDSVRSVLPSLGFLARINRFDFNSDDHKIKFEGGRFAGTKQGQDSVVLTPESMTYDLISGEMYAGNIEFLDVADSRIIPSGNRIGLNSSGEISTLTNAQLIMNREEKFHLIKNANIEVFNSNTYKGSGKYVYTNSLGQETEINIPDFGVKVEGNEGKKKGNVTRYSYALGEILEDEKFMLENVLFYKGNVLMDAKSPEINFDGFAKLDVKSVETDWFGLKQNIDPNNAIIKLDSLKNEQKQTLYSGIMMSPELVQLYPSVIAPKQSKSDYAIFSCYDQLKLGEEKGVFQFGDYGEAGISSTPYELTYNDAQKSMKAFGPVNLTKPMAEVKVDAFGDLDFDIESGQLKINTSLGIDFFMEDFLWEGLARDITDFNYSAKSIKYEDDLFKKSLPYFAPGPEGVKTLDQLRVNGYLDLPDDFSYKMFFKDVELVWDPLEANFKSIEPVGLVSVNNKSIDQEITATMEFGTSGSNGYWTIYLESSEGQWFFINYQKGRLGIMTSNTQYNSSIMNAKKRMISTKTSILYEYMPGKTSVKENYKMRIEDFKRRFAHSSTVKQPEIRMEVQDAVEELPEDEKDVINDELEIQELKEGEIDNTIQELQEDVDAPIEGEIDFEGEQLLEIEQLETIDQSVEESLEETPEVIEEIIEEGE